MPGKTKSKLDAIRLIGMVHLPPLPGSSASKLTMAKIINRATEEASILAKAGFDALIVENFGDAPFAAIQVGPETVAAMAIVLDKVVAKVKIPVGVNVLRNDSMAALGIAATSGASFIRVNVLSGVYATDQGFISGASHELLRRRAALAPNVRIAADVHVKHAQPISQPDIAEAAEETAYRAGGDALVVSGSATGAPADLDDVKRVAAAVPDRPVWIGSGVTAETVGDYLEVADAVIVGTSLKRGTSTTAPLDSARVRRFVRAAKQAL